MAFTRLQLIDELPFGVLRDDDQHQRDLHTFIEDVLQPSLELLYEDLDRFAAQLDPDTADENTVDAMLLDLGNPFEAAFALSLPRRRLLVKSLLVFYKQNGTGAGLTKIVRALTGVEVLEIISPASVRGWILGLRALGNNVGDPPPNVTTTNRALLGNSSTSIYSFQIRVDRTLTPEERATIRDIVRVVKPAHTHFYGIIEPGGGGGLQQWTLDQSLLGQDSDLG